MGGPKGRRLNVRVSEAEHAAISRRARLSGHTVSAYVRACALQDTSRPVIQADVEALRLIYRDLRHAGGNVNQIARSLNRSGTDGGAMEGALSDALDGLSRASGDISEFITQVQSSL